METSSDMAWMGCDVDWMRCAWMKSGDLVDLLARRLPRIGVSV